MKLTEILIVREDRLKCFQVDDATLSRLVCVRGNLYRDDPRLRAMADMPNVTQSQTPDIDPERQAWLDGAYARYLAEQAAKATPAAMPQTPQPERPKTPEEAWRTRPDIRAEFVSLTSYAAYCRAVRDGRSRLYGQGTSTR